MFDFNEVDNDYNGHDGGDGVAPEMANPMGGGGN
jgi:hypothetical protein